MLRILPTNEEELQTVQELQNLEELQVTGAALRGTSGETPPSPVFHPPTRAAGQGWGLEMGWRWDEGGGGGRMGLERQMDMGQAGWRRMMGVEKDNWTGKRLDERMWATAG